MSVGVVLTAAGQPAPGGAAGIGAGGISGTEHNFDIWHRVGSDRGQRLEDAAVPR
jgi:hypothetical protein